MGHAFQVSKVFRSPDETADFAASLAPNLGPGDCILLFGEIGAGKSHFARSLIQARLKDAGLFVEDVPSPTFTLVQTYDVGQTEVWHADLYRLASQDDVEELGLIGAFLDAICLVEWPEILGDLAPIDALEIHLGYGSTADSRNALLQSNSARWKDIIPSEARAK